MSSTNRTNAKSRHISDYYATPKPAIMEFFNHWIKDECSSEHEDFIGLGNGIEDIIWLDPCAGGDDKNDMSYPHVIENYLGGRYITTIDIREDSPADYCVDFMKYDGHHADIVITNPPFNIAEHIIQKAFSVTNKGGFVIMLLRLNFLGSVGRKPFFDKYPPSRIYVHHKRLSFTEDRKTDSIEYAHFVWRMDGLKHDTILKVI